MNNKTNHIVSGIVVAIFYLITMFFAAFGVTKCLRSDDAKTQCHCPVENTATDDERTE